MPKHRPGLCCRPLREQEGAVRCGQGPCGHFCCLGAPTLALPQRVLDGGTDFVCQCGAARVMKWRAETTDEKENGQAKGVWGDVHMSNAAAPR